MQRLRDIGARWWGRGTAIVVFGIAGVTASAPLAPLGANGERTVALYNIHTKKTLRVVYKRNGGYLPAAMKKINWHLRDWRRNLATRIDPKLIDLIWEIHTELGSRVPMQVISGYRSPKTNALLRKTRGGQAKRSLHMLGKAIDVRFPDIPVRRLRYSALLREQGGVGYYPTSATPFVHVDTGRVRHWPRMRRQELALLFPQGRTRHRPRSGGPITRNDAIAARTENPSLARRVAAFHGRRRNGPVRGADRTRIAAAVVERPKLLEAPKLVQPPRPARVRPEKSRFARAAAGAGGAITRAGASGDRRVGRAAIARAGPAVAFSPPPAPVPPRPVLVARASEFVQPSVAPSRKLTEPAPLPFEPRTQAAKDQAMPPVDRDGLFQLAKSLLGDNGLRADKEAVPRLPVPRLEEPARAEEWIAAPAFDEAHPEELFYRPFLIVPFITQTASADDVALRELKHPDVDRTLELLDADGGDDSPLQLRPGLKVANLLWLQSFSGGRAISARTSANDQPSAAQRKLSRRLVRLAGR